MTNDTIPLAEIQALAEFRYQLRRYLRVSEVLVREYGITSLQYQMLLQLKGYPGRQWTNVGELAERLQSHHHGVVSLVSRCEKLGLVERRTGREDARNVEIHLTERGDTLVTRLARLHRDELLARRGVFSVPTEADLVTRKDAQDAADPR
ncbi:MarR family winged helix-turn-helix transcriptional regulator [Pseudazoarcus pumilus]|uniref:MarR family transcriptional regulator n=1 Tax=Pseudazoarcus pumilus TaxID=2067960 RepID=A0A2I6S6X0_9RHOO|nr:MarR family transcriptional regulator [Pseudazoarcus pumilus]AUN95010.1 MarR family transcriptional regulator [Pseudazoarcus pumilus]